MITLELSKEQLETIIAAVTTGARSQLFKASDITCEKDKYWGDRSRVMHDYYIEEYDLWTSVVNTLKEKLA